MQMSWLSQRDRSFKRIRRFWAGHSQRHLAAGVGTRRKSADRIRAGRASFHSMNSKRSIFGQWKSDADEGPVERPTARHHSHALAWQSPVNLFGGRLGTAVRWRSSLASAGNFCLFQFVFEWLKGRPLPDASSGGPWASSPAAALTPWLGTGVAFVKCAVDGNCPDVRLTVAQHKNFIFVKIFFGQDKTTQLDPTPLCNTPSRSLAIHRLVYAPFRFVLISFDSP